MNDSRIGSSCLRAPLLVGVVIGVLVAGVGLAVAGVGEAPGAGGGSVDLTGEAAVAYLMGGGVSERDARVRLSRESEQIAVATRLRRQAPDDIRSVWIDDDGVLMASVVTDRGAALAEAAGVVPVLVTFAAAEVEAAREALIDDVMSSPPPGFSGASFEIDESAGRVIARYFFAEAPGVVPAAATELGDLVQATAEAGELGATADVYAGHMTSRGGFEFDCTLGWAVDIVGGPNPEDQAQGMMTAGHCFDTDEPPEDTVFSIRTPVVENLTSAVGVAYVYGPPGDYGYLRLNGGDTGHPAVDIPVGLNPVREIGDPVVGTIICKFGRATKETCGKIERVNVSTVIREYGENVLVTGMTRTSFCAEPGDSGGPVYASYTGFGATDLTITALGLVSSSILHMKTANGVWQLVCGEKIGRANEALFTPLSNIDTADRFFVRIAGG